jgi:hypothetical protein
MPNNQSLVFIESTKLCAIISHISEVHAERRAIQPEELMSIEESLSDWVSHLPEQLQLYGVNGDRKSYCKPVSEISIQYFVAIILSEVLRYRDKEGPRRVSIPSLLAASCAAALYDEVNCRDETMLLPWINGIFCLLLALPLIHYKPQSPAKEAARKRDLTVLRSILIGMRGRYGDSEMALGLMERLEKRIDRSPTTHQHLGNDSNQEPCLLAVRLFPFPATLCENMDLLEMAVSPVNQFITDNFTPLQHWPANNVSFDWNVLDLFGSDFVDVNVDFENDGNQMAIDEQNLN